VSQHPLLAAPAAVHTLRTRSLMRTGTSPDYSQPRSSAVLTAAARLRVPVLAIAADR